LLENDSEITPSRQALERAAEILNGTSRVAILAGAGCASSHAELIEFAKALHAPITHALRGKEYVEFDNPFDVGMSGLLGFSSGYAAMKHADALVILGATFPIRSSSQRMRRSSRLTPGENRSADERMSMLR
jgi:pyruvate dehydrogenase (quinone)